MGSKPKTQNYLCRGVFILFRKVNIEISNICNLQCSFCPEVIRPKAMMSLDTFQVVISQVSQVTRLVAFHLMGEPLVHPELKTFLDLCQEHRLRVFFVTNGVLLKEPSVLLHPVIQQVSFSLHSFTDNFPEKDPALYLKRIFDFTETAFQERPTLFINYRLWNRNSKKGTDRHSEVFYQAIEERFQVSITRDWNYRFKKNLVLKKYLSLHFDTEFTWPEIDLPVLGESGTCYGLRSHFGVLVDGTVVPCCLDKEGNIPLGNLTEQPLKTILKSPRAQRMIEGFRNRQLEEDLCQRCQYIERF
ncbi:radical SAM/SPASM domain-containing protein [bacterium]|nr:radical SAM/SPASM domain-containing protein [bacterium]NBX83934.1 radical SAM/SPASM domain-containing protein [bacterium]